MAQLSYGYSTPANVPGGIADISARTIVSRTNIEEDMGIPLGTGVVQGKNPGQNVKLPSTSSTSALFEGIVVDGGITPVGEDGKVLVRKGAAANVMTAGKVWVRCAGKAEPAYGEQAFLVTDGAEKGYFTTSADSGNASKMKLYNVRFLGKKDGGIALAEIFASMEVALSSAAV